MKANLPTNLFFKKIVFVFSIFLAVSVFPNLSWAQWSYCQSGELEIHQVRRTETQNCQSGGYCRMWDYNPQTLRYEEYYGYHFSCPGTQQRDVEQFECQRSDGSRYPGERRGYWGVCILRY